MPTNPLQKSVSEPSSWFHNVIHLVFLATAEGALKYQDGVVAQWPKWLVRKLRKVIVKTAKEQANWTIAGQAREIERLKRLLFAQTNHAESLELRLQTALRVLGDAETQLDAALPAWRDAIFQRLGEPAALGAIPSHNGDPD